MTQIIKKEKMLESTKKSIEKDIRKAYIFLRENNHTIPSDILQYMLDASLEKLNYNNFLDKELTEISKKYNIPKKLLFVEICDADKTIDVYRHSEIFDCSTYIKSL